MRPPWTPIPGGGRPRGHQRPGALKVRWDGRPDDRADVVQAALASAALAEPVDEPRERFPDGAAIVEPRVLDQLGASIGRGTSTSTPPAEAAPRS